MTLLVVSIAPRTAADLAVRSVDAWARGADAVEVRIDGFEDDPGTIADYLRTHATRSWIVTCRSQREGGHSTASANDRAAATAVATAGTGALIDVELADLLQDGGSPRTALASAAGHPTANDRLIVSSHDFEPMTAQDRAAALTRHVEKACAVGVAAVAKVAYRSETIHESFAALDIMREYGTRVVGIAMGEAGAWTRVLAKKLGAFASFASLDTDTATAPGQISVGEMIQRYRWQVVDKDTRVYGVLGDPVGHSMSPLLFNQWFARNGLNAVYLPLLVDPQHGGLGRFLDACRQRPWLDIGGFSVTIPHKATASDWLGDGADAMSQSIGAANTIQFDADRVRGYNTDAYAAVSSLADAMSGSFRDLAGTSVDVLGTGGAARAVLHGLCELGAHLTIYGRSAERTRSLADEFHATPASWDARVDRAGEIVINTTSVGLWPNVAESPMPRDALRDVRLVFDLIYNPLETRLLREAVTAGAAALNGLDMFVRQAAMQFELWTGLEPDRSVGASIIRQYLEKPATGLTLKQPIILIGLRGSGKTCVGRALAERLAVDFVDTDECICQETGKDIATIFAEEGETGFREYERRIIERVAGKASGVISVGGGAVMNEHIARLIGARGFVVWLSAPATVLWDRVCGDRNSAASRPPLTERSGLEEMEHLLAVRAPTYDRLCDIRVDTSAGRPKQVAERILRALRSVEADG